MFGKRELDKVLYNGNSECVKWFKPRACPEFHTPAIQANSDCM